jgi:hypothetical protein
MTAPCTADNTSIQFACGKLRDDTFRHSGEAFVSFSWRTFDVFEKKQAEII